jgi:predicted lipoprotein with Yx(FWY)xxD motif
MVALMFAGCGGGGDSSSGVSPSEDETKAGSDREAVTAEASSSEPEARAPSAGATKIAVVKVMATPELGRVVVDARGRTLYDSHADNPMIYQFSRPPIPSCYEACAETWPPLLTSASPKAIEGADADLIGTIERKDGAEQVTYDGHPLYTFVEDTEPGEANGDDVISFDSGWHALEPDGEEPTGEVGEGR